MSRTWNNDNGFMLNIVERKECKERKKINDIYVITLMQIYRI